mmetsp:Transcript_11052/g.33153  ORF Transcript_11052/g.33153 Transcript_11052/m.33153 type:complete len:83 (+) Transcript_11052:720-968(+)
MGLLMARHLSIQLRRPAEQWATALNEAHRNSWDAARLSGFEKPEGQNLEPHMSVLIKLLACQPACQEAYWAASMWMRPMEAA